MYALVLDRFTAVAISMRRLILLPFKNKKDNASYCNSARLSSTKLKALKLRDPASIVQPKSSLEQHRAAVARLSHTRLEAIARYVENNLE